MFSVACFPGSGIFLINVPESVSSLTIFVINNDLFIHKQVKN